MYGQPMMGQPMMGQPMMGQPMMGQPMMGQPMMGQPMMGMPMMPQPIFKQVAVGAGIDMTEFNTIVQAATHAYTMKLTPLSTGTANTIKQRLHGEWFVFCAPVVAKDYDFALSSVKGGDFMSFTLDHTLFQVCRIK